MRDSHHSLTDKLLLQFHEWEWIERSEEYVQTGEPLELHDAIGGEQWESYQRGMLSVARALAAEAVRRMPVPKGAKDLLDIGGSHGYYSVALCRRHQGLRAVVLDLPRAVEHAAALLAAEEMGDRVVHRVGDALSDELGVESYDLVITAQLVHHFTDEQNRGLTRRIARAQRPSGVYAILEEFRPDASEGGPDRRPARLLLRAHQSGRHVVTRGDGRVAAGGRARAERADPAADEPGRRHSGGCEAGLGAP